MSGVLSSFLFGNIDEDGRLESNYLDDEVKEALGNVAELGKLSKDIESDANLGPSLEFSEPSSSSNYFENSITPLSTAADYTEIDELAEDESQFKVPEPIDKARSKDSKRSDEDSKVSAIIKAPNLSNLEKAQLLFPDFAPDKKLRFSRMFGNSVTGRDLDKTWKYGKKKKKYKHPVIENGLWTKSSLPPAPEVDPDQIAPGDMENILKSDEPEKPKEETKNMPEIADIEQDFNDWRNGPGSYWYDLANVPKNAKSYDYGFRLSKEQDDTQRPVKVVPKPCQEIDNIYLMYNQLEWEDLVVWNTSQVKSPDRKHKELLDFTEPETQYKDVAESSLPSTNRKILDNSWEKQIIWDTKNMKVALKAPEILVDPNAQLKIPIEKEKNISGEKAITPKKEYPSKMRMKPLTTIHPLHGELMTDKRPKVTDPYFTLSNEEYYQPKPTSTENVLTKYKSVIQHSIPALELELEWFPTYMKPEELRRLHRPYLKPMRSGPHSEPVFKPVYSLERHVRRKENEREAERLKSGGGSVFFMRTKDDLSATDGRLVLFEYSEEHPLLLSCIGMASRIKNYSKKTKEGDPIKADNLIYGEQTYERSPYFLGKILPGQVLQVMDNNMYQAPTYPHSLPPTDFILSRTAESYYIRMTEDIFVVGQQFPKIVVPGPNSKRANQHTRNFLQVFIYRLFLESDDIPRKIKMDNIKAAFPAYSESSIRKRLKNCADFNRTGSDCGWWVLQNDFRLPSEEEIRKLVLPEDCCAFYSMQYAAQRLKDAGYGKSIKNLSDDEDEEDSDKILDDEVRIAPWTLTRCFNNALHGKCQLEITGKADPTGCGEGFSYLRVPNKPSIKSKESKEKADKTEAKSTRTVMGTDSDLRRLTLKNAKNVLRDFKVPEEKIESLSRWDVINLVRKLSTEAARSGEAPGMGKFARGAKYSLLEHQEKYKEECQRIFDLQTRVLSSVDVLSTDDENSSDDEGNIDELGKDLESMLNKKKTMEQISMEKEEAVRRDLQKMLAQDIGARSMPLNDKPEPSASLNIGVGDEAGRRLIITRKFSNGDNGYYYREEVIARPEVIDAYLKINETAEKTNKRYIIDNLDEEQKDEVRKERRRLQEQLRRLNKAQERERQKEKKLRKAAKEKAPINMKCGACGETGHMKTNKHCKYYGKSGSALTEDQFLTDELSGLFNQEQNSTMVKVEDTKIRIGRALLAKVDEVNQKAAQKKAEQKKAEQKCQMEQSKDVEEKVEVKVEVKVPKKRKVIEPVERKPVVKIPKTVNKVQEDLDYLEPKVKGSNRSRVHPEVELRTFFEIVISKMKEIPTTGAFHKPVSAKEIPDYYKFISDPMDLQTMKNHCANNYYQSREDFLEHLYQIVQNSTIYNGKESLYTKAAENMVQLCKDIFSQNEEKLQTLEEKINPAANKSTQNQFNLILLSSVDAMLKVSHSQAFHIPVNAKYAPDYYQVISTPMDLTTLRKNIEKNKYKSGAEFLKDINLIYENSKQYNGPESSYTKKAEELVNNSKELLSKNHEMLYQYEILLSCETEQPPPLSQVPPSPKPISRIFSPLSPAGSSLSEVIKAEGYESDTFSDDQFLTKKTRYDSIGVDEDISHTLYEDLMDSEDDSS